ncbi:hypothetical protein T484DRAFT_1783154 [Baffinella frigidus]|nr:hypothetical protein T484DRAFT_1783154 [Cryptophyta sp. CCMP2293]
MVAAVNEKLPKDITCLDIKRLANGRMYLYLIPTFSFRPATVPEDSGPKKGGPGSASWRDGKQDSGPKKGGPGSASWRDGKQHFEHKWRPSAEKVEASKAYRCDEKELKTRLDEFLLKLVVAAFGGEGGGFEGVAMRDAKELKARLHDFLLKYKGTHKFHNFGSGKKPTDGDVRRYIVSFKSGCRV